MLRGAEIRGCKGRFEPTRNDLLEKRKEQSMKRKMWVCKGGREAPSTTNQAPQSMQVSETP